MKGNFDVSAAANMSPFFNDSCPFVLLLWLVCGQVTLCDKSINSLRML